MSKDNRDFFEKKKVWSEIKDKLLGCYLLPYFQKILTTGKPVVYVDCFAGRGHFDDGKPGSPIIALDARTTALQSSKSTNKEIDINFIEKKYATDLQNVVSEYATTTWSPNIFSGKFEDNIKQILANSTGKNVFLYIDPYGIKEFGIAINGDFGEYGLNSFEMLINFNSFGFVRAACRALGVDYSRDEALSEKNEIVDYNELNERDAIKTLTTAVSGNYWKDIVFKFKDGLIDGYQAEEELTDALRFKLMEKYNYVLDLPIRVKKENHAKYRMIHVSNHADGCLLMADNMINRTDELIINIQQNNRITLFDIMNDMDITSSGAYITQREVKDKVEEYLKLSKRQHINEFRAGFYSRYGLFGTSVMINNALKELETEGKVRIERFPNISESTGKKLKYMTENGKQKVIVRSLV